MSYSSKTGKYANGFYGRDHFGESMKKFNFIDDGVRYCPECGDHANKHNVGFNQVNEIWYCKSCKDEVPEPMKNKPPIYKPIDFGEDGYIEKRFKVSGDAVADTQKEVKDDKEETTKLPEGSNPIFKSFE